MFKQHICGGDCETYFDNLFNCMKEGFLLNEIICDTAGRPVDFKILAFNKSFEQMFSIEHKNIFGESMNEVCQDAEPKLIEVMLPGDHGW